MSWSSRLVRPAVDVCAAVRPLLVAVLLIGAGVPSVGLAAAEEEIDRSESRPVPHYPRLLIDPPRLAAEGIRQIAGRRLTVLTDLGPHPELETYPAVFEQAFEQWCAFFRVPAERYADWHLNACLMKEKERFARAGLWPAFLPDFPNGYSCNYDFWLFDQPSDYYRRHLLLHEGTHSFMNTILGACGPRWYMEGVAELLATHRWQEGRLTMNYLPARREETPFWGRIRIIQDAVAERQARRLSAVVDVGPQAHNTADYAWCWAAALLLDRHPAYHERFRRLSDFVTAADFNDRFHQMWSADWQELCEQWQVMVVDMHYGQDIVRTAIDFAPGRPIAASGAEVSVAADRGWQNSGLVLQAGRTYRLRAQGRYQVADRPQVWWCEPGGVTIRYHQGRPLGLLLAAVRPDAPPADSSSALLRPSVVGLGAELSVETTGTLFLKINESPAELADNAGSCSVVIEP